VNQTTTKPVENATQGRASPIARAMTRLRAAARRRLAVERGSAFLAAALLVLLGAVLLDYLFRFPIPLRLAMLAAGLALATAALVRAFRPVLRFKPTLVEVALRVEHSEQAKRAGLSGRLASALELDGPEVSGRAPDLAQASVADALARFGTINPSAATLLTSTRAQRGLASLALALLPVLGALWLVPGYAAIGLARTLTPWSGHVWPKRTMVASEPPAAAHPLDTPITLRASLLRSNRAHGETEVRVAYRVVIEGEPGPETTLVLNPVRASDSDAYEAAISRDALRLAAGLASADASATGERVLEYRFITADDETAAERVALVERPSITAVVSRVTPPDYAAASPVVASGDAQVSLDVNKRGTLGPVLAGSRVALTFTLSKPVPVPGDANDGERPAPSEEAWARQTLGAGFETLPEGASWSRRGTRWTLSWNAAANTTLSLRPVDAFDISAAEESTVAVVVVPDSPPGATVIDPAQDEAVLASALIPLTGVGRDDVGLTLVRLEAQRHSPPAGTSGGAPEPMGDVLDLARIENPPFPTATPITPAARVSAEINLGDLPLAPGDEVWVTAVAVDGYEAGGVRHDPVRSTPRKLRVISEAQLTQQILDELAALRTAAERIDQDQASIAERSREATKSGEARERADDLAREQRGIGERLTPATDLLRRARERAERNALSDQSLQTLLDDAAGMVERAAEASERAAEAADEVARTPQDQPADQRTAEAMARGQNQVREEMGRLADVLSRGRDGWAARQQVDRLLTEQRDLIEQTRRAGERAAGRTPEELTPEQRADLERVARAQEDLARKTREAAEDLAERAERIRPTDPAQADAMQRAAQQALREETPERMREAGEQARQNQTGQAQQNQQQAAETLEEMLRELDRAQQRRDEALQRMLANLEASITGLITQQRAELKSLTDAIAENKPEGYAPLAERMVRLHANTLAVADTTEAREAAEIVARLEAAASNQDAAAANLRDVPDPLTAEQSERMSLKRLEEARELARTLQQKAQERDQARKRAELRMEYGKILEAQETLTRDTAGLVGKEVGRRERNTIKTLGTRQAEIRDRLREIRDKTEGLSQTTMFEYAHRRLDRATDGAATTLAGEAVPTQVARQQAETASVLRSLLNALKQGEPPRNDFRQQQGGQQPAGGDQQQGDQQQQQGPIPPLAELMVLKEMQEEAARRTREISAAPDAAEVEAIGVLQKELAELGAKVVEMLKAQQQGGGGAEGGGR
jgi:hypothetical protein